MQSYKINTEWLHLMLQIKIAATTSNVHLWIEWYDICGRILATDNFDIRNYNTNTTRSGNHLTLHHHRTVSATHHFYFNQIVRLWYHLLVINVSTPSYVIKQNLKHLWDHFIVNFNSDQSCSFHISMPSMLKTTTIHQFSLPLSLTLICKTTNRSI